MQFYCEADVRVGETLTAELDVDDTTIQPINVTIKIIRSEHTGEYYRISAEVIDVQQRDVNPHRVYRFVGAREFIPAMTPEES